MIKRILIKDFSLRHSLECGQFFRFVKKNGWYYIGYRNKLFKAKQNKNVLYFSNASEKFIRKFFHLGFDYNRVFKNSKIPYIAKARKQFKGLRIIQQDPWECLISYVCSANNNIPKIKKMINSLCVAFGRKIRLDDAVMYSFPEPGSLKGRDKIKKCVYTGVKTQSLLRINKSVSLSGLNQLKNNSFKTAFDSLTRLYGVGPKIANCVMLFSLGFFDAVPVDTHMQRVLAEKYGLSGCSNARLSRKTADYLGSYAGIIAEYLFYQQRLS